MKTLLSQLSDASGGLGEVRSMAEESVKDAASGEEL